MRDLLTKLRVNQDIHDKVDALQSFLSGTAYKRQQEAHETKSLGNWKVEPEKRRRALISSHHFLIFPDVVAELSAR